MKEIKRTFFRVLSNRTIFIRIFFEKLFYKQWNNFPFGLNPLGKESEYIQLWKDEIKEKYIEVDKYEKQTKSAVPKDFLNSLALHTQVTKKKSKICYAHGRVLYSALSNYIDQNKKLKDKKITIFETGTARGFSSLCMAYALKNKKKTGSIFTFDVLPHNIPMYWNIIDDLEGPLTRSKLLAPWKDLVQEYIVFIQGNTRIELPKVQVERINFAFLDGAHTYKDIMFEFHYIQDKQEVGDLIIYDDYSPRIFPGLVKAIDEICTKFKYQKYIIKTKDDRSYLIAQKTKDS